MWNEYKTKRSTATKEDLRNKQNDQPISPVLQAQYPTINQSIETVPVNTLHFDNQLREEYRYEKKQSLQSYLSYEYVTGIPPRPGHEVGIRVSQ